MAGGRAGEREPRSGTRAPPGRRAGPSPRDPPGPALAARRGRHHRRTAGRSRGDRSHPLGRDGDSASAPHPPRRPAAAALGLWRQDGRQHRRVVRRTRGSLAARPPERLALPLGATAGPVVAVVRRAALPADRRPDRVPAASGAAGPRPRAADHHGAIGRRPRGGPGHPHDDGDCRAALPGRRVVGARHRRGAPRDRRHGRRARDRGPHVVGTPGGDRPGAARARCRPGDGPSGDPVGDAARQPRHEGVDRHRGCHRRLFRLRLSRGNAARGPWHRWHRRGARCTEDARALLRLRVDRSRPADSRRGLGPDRGHRGRGGVYRPAVDPHPHDGAHDGLAAERQARRDADGELRVARSDPVPDVARGGTRHAARAAPGGPRRGRAGASRASGHLARPRGRARQGVRHVRDQHRGHGLVRDA